MDIIIPKFITITDDNEVIQCPGYTLKIEHSLDAISKWESKYKKPYLEQKQLTVDEFLYYVDCMILNKDELPDNVCDYLTKENGEQIQQFIEDVPSATVIKRNMDSKTKKRFTTSELIYAYMAQARIPFTADKWNIYRLLKVLEIISIDSQPPKKVPRSQTLNKYRAMNKARRRKK